MTERLQILIIYTGGTIGMIKDYKTEGLKAFNFSLISEKIPELRQLDCDIQTVSFENPIDSSNMNVEYYLKIARIIEQNYQIFDGFIVLTGSDTMSYASSALSFMLENLQKPVIFTGSQLPIGDLRTDAKENLITSIAIACCRKKNNPIISEVCLYFEYKLYRANRTTKLNSEQFEAFASLNYPPLAESGVHLSFNHHLLYKPDDGDKKLTVKKKLDPNIFVLKLFPGITKNVLKQVIDIQGLKGIVLETYGSGNAPTYDWFIELLEIAIKKGIYIVNITQCVGGSVMPGHYQTSVELKEMGVINGKNMTVESAIAKMMCLLAEKVNKKEFKIAFQTSLRGEIDSV